ncbi:MAG: QueT transporter family protein [Ruminococcus sp.]|nr:QueT transporter family protein [Ruminococcus sp.]
MRKNKVQYISHGALIAALYVALTYVSAASGLASGAVQLRLSEALTVLPLFTPAAVPGLTVGCFLANLTTGCSPWDIVGGTLATFLGAIGTYKLKNVPYAGAVPPVVSNTVIIPLLLRFAYQLDGTLPYFILTVGIGELISCGVFGTLLTAALRKNSKRFSFNK